MLFGEKLEDWRELGGRVLPFPVGIVLVPKKSGPVRTVHWESGRILMTFMNLHDSRVRAS